MSLIKGRGRQFIDHISLNSVEYLKYYPKLTLFTLYMILLTYRLTGNKLYCFHKSDKTQHQKDKVSVKSIRLVNDLSITLSYNGR